jgi:hypothetical protein
MKNLGLIISIALLAACHTSKDEKEALIENKLQKFISSETRICLVIPREGCGGCISDATSYMIKNSQRYKGLQIVFTGVNDMKELRYKVGREFLSKSYVSIDSSNILMTPAISSIYPQLYYLENKSIKKMSKFDVNDKSLDKHQSNSNNSPSARASKQAKR